MVAVDRTLTNDGQRPEAPGGGTSTRRYLALMSTAIALPPVIICAFVAWHYAETQRSNFEAQVSAAAQAVMAVTEREIIGMAETLRALATSPSLAAGDIESFHRQSVDLGRILDASIVLRSLDGQQIANSLVPWGNPLPARSSLTRWDQTALDASEPLVSDHYVGIVRGEHSIAVVTAVRREGTPIYLLHIGLSARRLTGALTQLGFDDTRLGVVTDRNGVVLARTRDHDSAVGTPTTISGRLPQRGGVTSGRLEDRGGNPVFFVAKSSSTTELIAIASTLIETLAAEQRRAGLLAAVVVLFALALSVGGARIFGGPLALALQRLAEAGRALGQRLPVQLPTERIAELNGVRDALQQASDEIAAHDRERNLALQELDHRVKNLLATVTALASLTTREAGATEAPFHLRFAERLRALARSHDALVRGGGSEAELQEVLESELSLHDQAGGGRVSLSGPPIALRSAAATAIGMIAHELATNAAKYGALSCPEGRVAVEWCVAEGPEEVGPLLELRWIEAGGPPVLSPRRQGFGSRLIERGLARQLQASVRIDFAPEGVRFDLRMPLRPAALRWPAPTA